MTVKLLSERGDPIERKALFECGLGEKFPRYAEFWAKYVYPYRDSDKSKLRLGFPVPLEEICNNHYSVFYHLTHAYLQLTYLAQTPLDESVIDVGNPLYHLATAVDLTERTFVAVFRVSGRLTIKKLEKSEFDNCAKTYWENGKRGYDRGFEAFKGNFTPVDLKLHSVGELFEEHLKGVPARKKFKAISLNIRTYRNILIHSLSPLRIRLGDIVFIPKPEHLSKYRQGHWSSERNVDLDDYAPAVKMIRELADELVASSNDLWGTLLSEMETEEIKSLYARIAAITATLPTVASSDTTNYTGGSLMPYVPPPSGYIPPATPSAIKFISYNKKKDE